MDRPRDSIAAVVRSRHGPAGGAKFTTGRGPRIVRSHSLVAPLLLHNLKARGQMSMMEMEMESHGVSES